MKTRLPALLLPPRRRHLLRQPPLDLAGERERRPAHDGELPVRLDAARRRGCRGSRTSSASPCSRARRAPRATSGSDALARRGTSCPGCGSMSMRSSSGCSVSRRREGHGWKSTTARFAAQITCASSVTHSSSAWRPDGNVTRAASTHSGALLGHALLVDRLAVDAVREAAELRRPLVQRPDDALSDREVVLGEVELRLAAPSGRAPCPGSSA